jgi:hypothetical protein
LRWNGTLTDIEERKRAEDERERLRRLEAQIAHTNRLSMLGELAASIAHENQSAHRRLRSRAPVRACAGWIASSRRCNRRAMLSCASKTTANARLTSSPGFGPFYKKDISLERVSIDVNEVVRECCVLLRGEADRYAVTMRTELAPDLPGCVRQPGSAPAGAHESDGQWHRGDEGGRRGTRHQEPKPERWLKVSVSDTGVGIPAEQIDRSSMPS